MKRQINMVESAVVNVQPCSNSNDFKSPKLEISTSVPVFR